MKLKCVGCGEAEKVSFRTWWFYWARSGTGDTGPWLHLPCWDNYVDQRRLDGLD